MIRLLAQWRALHREYRTVKSSADDYFDIVSALLFTLGALALGIGVAALIGGSHG